MRFNGEEFPSMKAFKRAYPIYASYADAVRDGADTVMKLEVVIAGRASNGAACRYQATSALRARLSNEAKRTKGVRP